MANQEQLDILEQGVEMWNQWRKKHARVRPDLKGAHLSFADLRFAHLSFADLSRADLSFADLSRADLSHAILEDTNLSHAILDNANFNRADLAMANLYSARILGADLSESNLYLANLYEAELRKTNLRNADLRGVNLVKADLEGANLTEARVYGIAAWSLITTNTIQSNLIITDPLEPAITVDNLEVAQFIYLLLNNPKIRDVIDTIAKKAVLILGRFTPERKAILDALRDALRRRNYSPIVFDFEKPGSRNFTETVRTLAHLSRFIIADLTDPSSVSYELAQIIPGLAIPVQAILLEGEKPFAMFADLPRMYHWVLPIHFYINQAHLLATLQGQVIAPAEQKAQELEKLKNGRM